MAKKNRNKSKKGRSFITTLQNNPQSLKNKGNKEELKIFLKPKNKK
jgi:hypothetical protein